MTTTTKEFLEKYKDRDIMIGVGEEVAEVIPHDATEDKIDELIRAAIDETREFSISEAQSEQGREFVDYEIPNIELHAVGDYGDVESLELYDQCEDCNYHTETVIARGKDGVEEMAFRTDGHGNYEQEDLDGYFGNDVIKAEREEIIKQVLGKLSEHSLEPYTRGELYDRSCGYFIGQVLERADGGFYTGELEPIATYEI